MKLYNWIIGFLVVFAILIGVLIVSHLLGYSLLSVIKLSNDTFPLLASLGVIVSALLATASSAKIIANTNLQKEKDIAKNKKVELFYIKHYLMKIEITMIDIREAIKENELKNFTNEQLKTISCDIHDWIEKLDSKELFYLLSDDGTTSLMNLLARMASIKFFIIEPNLTIEERQKMILSNLINYNRGMSLFDAIEKLKPYMK